VEAEFFGDSHQMAKTFTCLTASLIGTTPMAVAEWRHSISAMDTRFGALRTRRAENESPANPSLAAAITVTPGVVFSGTMDGQLFAYSAQTGKIIWQFNTARDYITVNGVKANGGSMSNAGPTVVDGMLFSNSGYSHHGGVTPAMFCWPSQCSDLSVRNAPAGCRFWQEAARRVFATSSLDHAFCAIGQYTHNLDADASSSGELHTALKVFDGQSYVREQDLPLIPVLRSKPKYVIYGPLALIPLDPKVVLLFVRAD
jgi:hypothetical protein